MTESPEKRAKNVAGRKTSICTAIIEQLCREISAGKSVAKICQEDWAPDRTTFYSWLSKSKDKDEENELYQIFANRYALATETRAECHIEEVMDIADDTGIEVDRARLRIDTRMKYSEKCHPTKYGKKQMLTDETGVASPRLIIMSPDKAKT